MEQQLFGGAAAAQRPARPVYQAMRRGFAGRCPHCGQGRLFRAFLKTEERCPACGEAFFHHRADDLPAYLVIVIVGHIVVGGFMGLEASTDWPGWLHLAIWAPVTLAMALALLGPTKGSIIGLQWACHMHGFGGEEDRVEDHPELNEGT